MLNHSDLSGGAARASFRIFQSLKKYGVDVSMLVKTKLSDDSAIYEVSSFRRRGVLSKIDVYNTKLKNYYYKTQLKKYNVQQGYFLSNLSSINLSTALQSIDFDIIHLNWISHEYLNIDMLRTLKKPIVWTLHDCWAFTGICHYFDQCNNYTSSCGSCSLLNSVDEKDLSNEIWRKKSLNYELCIMHIVTPSHWLGNSAQQSSLLKNKPISVIPYPINTDIFTPQDKVAARERLGLKQVGKYVLFGAMNALDDQRKGYQYIDKAVKLLASQGHTDIQLVIFGTSKSFEERNECISIIYLNSINNDAKMIDLYSAADVTVVPSISENLSLVIMESLACGTPVVAFDIGGNPDMIDHKKDGYLATPYSAEEIANGILWVLSNTNEGNLAYNARQKILDKYSEKTIAEKYIKLYDSIL